jgi:hypothetical protein
MTINVTGGSTADYALFHRQTRRVIFVGKLDERFSLVGKLDESKSSANSTCFRRQTRRIFIGQLDERPGSRTAQLYVTADAPTVV